MKIACYSCAQKLDLTELPPFTKIDCPVCQAKIIVPKQFGNILLEEDLGTGRLAQVYRAMDITLDREVAVKVLKDDILDTDAANQFITEARSASAVNHPSVIPIYSCGEMEGKPYITMQYMDGGSLLRRIKAKKETTSYQICKWFEDTVKALDSAALHGVVHHDIKPANIFLDLDKNIKVGDFAIARVLDSGKPLFDNNKVSPDVTLDMSYYLSPEKVTTGRHDTAAEIYSLGATMYHLACGVPPFNSDDPEENIRARFEGPVKPLEEHTEDLDPELGKLISRMLSIYPSDRPQNYRDLIEELGDMRKRLKGSGSISKSTAGKATQTDQKTEVPLVKPAENIIEADAPVKATKNVIAIAPSRRDRNRAEYFIQKGAMYYLARLIPLTVIAAVLVIMIAHFQGCDILPLGETSDSEQVEPYDVNIEIEE